MWGCIHAVSAKKGAIARSPIASRSIVSAITVGSSAHKPVSVRPARIVKSPMKVRTIRREMLISRANPPMFVTSRKDPRKAPRKRQPAKV